MNKTSDAKNIFLLAGWIIGLLAVISLIWIFTRSIQMNYLMRTVNRMFINTGDSRRLSEPVDTGRGKTDIFGFWYKLNNSSDEMFIFAFFQDGILIPLGAVVNKEGTVDDVIPLSGHAMRVFDDLSENIIYIYINRIEQSAYIKTRGIKI